MQAIEGGCTLVQLREKNCSSLEFCRTAAGIKKITDRYHIPLIINDRADIALAAGAAGVHVGQDDIPAAAARRIIGKNGILGVSVSTVEEALRAQADGADYLGVGALFPTGTKPDAQAVPIEVLKNIVSASRVPVAAIGGISRETLPFLKNTGIAGIAVVSAVMAAKDISGAARELKEIFYKLFN
jgi:thiamine-phosphate pyrophosphorylase